MIESGNGQVELHVASQRDREGRCGRVPVVRVGDHDRVGGELVVMVHQEVLERARPVLLFALDEYREAEVEVAAEDGDHGADGRDVRHDAGLVIRRSPAEQTVTANRRFERGRLPVFVFSGRLDVVVCVQQDGRLAVSSGARREHRGLAKPGAVVEFCPRDLDFLEDAEVLQERLHGRRAVRDVLRVEPVPGNRWDANEAGQVGNRARKPGLHRVGELLDERG